MKRYFIVGVTGFLGSALARHLRSRGRSVGGLAPASARGEALAREGVDFRPGDVRDPAVLKNAMAGHDVVVNLAGAYRREGRPLRDFFDINVTGAENVMAAAVAVGAKRVIHVSTTGVYGRLVEIPATEEHPYDFTNHYQKTKIEGEVKARDAFAGPLKGRGVVIRPAGVYGPGDRKFVKLMRAIQRGYGFYVGPCTAQFHPTYVDDFLDGMELALESPRAAGEIYNIVGGEYLTVQEFIETVARVLGRPPPRIRVPMAPMKVAAHVCERVCRLLRIEPPIYPRRLGFFDLDRAYSHAKASRELGYAPKVGLDEGLRRAAAWYRQSGML
ncbi:MAG: NAD-dependent epimerase/dehydratase family protein [Betaproteobacteria bacterium]|nr:NAD-dependent epimerase/dehydratase family protein [Betaproteobacteria bacterium]